MTAPIHAPAGWMAIRQYRDFWDVPRVFLVELDGRLVLFDCAFEEETEDYSDHYRVYLMPPVSDRELDGSWAELPARAIRSLGTVPVGIIRFDATKRAFVEAPSIHTI